MSTKLLLPYQSALITGSTGLIGSYFIPRLCSALPHLEIKIAGRQIPSSSKFLSVHLDLSDAVKLDIRPDVIFHIAGEKQDESRMWNVNYEGTRKLLEWALARDIRRFIYLSSVGVYGAEKDSGEVKETSSKDPQNTYEQSKHAAEELVKQLCTDAAVEYVILQPSNVLGLRQNSALPLLGMMKMIKRGLFTYFGKRTSYFNYVAVEDVADGLIASTTHQAANRSFILNTPVSMKEAVDWIADEIGARIPTRRLPAGLGFTAGELASVVSNISGMALPFSRERYKELTNTTYYNGNAIVDTIGFSYQMGIETSIRRLARYYMEHKLL